MERQSQRKQNGKDADNTTPSTPNPTRTTSEAFASLTKHLLAVTRDELRALEQSWRDNKPETDKEDEV